MRRRQFLKVFGGAAVAGPAAGWPWAAGAQQQQQQPAMPRIGVLMGVRNGDSEGRRWAFRFIQILREHGWRNGTNVQIEMRWAVEVEKIRAQAQELVDLKPDVIHVTTAIATAEVLRRTSTIPVVFSMVNDPVTLGFVKNTEKPDGNATGFTNISPTLVKNWLGLLKEISPKISRIAVLFNPVPGSILEQRWDQFEAAAASLGVTVERTAVRNIAELEKAVESLGQDPGAGIILIPDPFFNLARSGVITSIINRHRVVTLYPFRDFVLGGGLASFSVNFTELERRSAEYVDRILKGAPPADLPVQPPEKYEVVINLRAAKQLGLTVPAAVLARATEVLE